mmetsp:Transcript_23663/g.30868  ORF Transcript_23663/g.30868 Transcript_23663/m.30868 type:complete len:211 (-) Transcript_23663:86-718(-)|eukprot:CAMPEP_0195290862 /NCGR_PEP_ID=MMETSP0707-20130614/6558_1 /TAXON_ID=33640 /ORGANISM="Asterionellopsis glacialis, Strain CCMP134" /LENGTH=210 /DNA_ID=CAMNT_0040351043 /DNA_START=24 /DNA_END=656 /DNA_ORIENTATION=-
MFFSKREKAIKNTDLKIRSKKQVLSEQNKRISSTSTDTCKKQSKKQTGKKKKASQATKTSKSNEPKLSPAEKTHQNRESAEAQLRRYGRSVHSMISVDNSGVYSFVARPGSLWVVLTMPEDSDTYHVNVTMPNIDGMVNTSPKLVQLQQESKKSSPIKGGISAHAIGNEVHLSYSASVSHLKEDKYEKFASEVRDFVVRTSALRQKMGQQ